MMQKRCSKSWKLYKREKSISKCNPIVLLIFSILSGIAKYKDVYRTLDPHLQVDRD